MQRYHSLLIVSENFRWHISVILYSLNGRRAGKYIYRYNDVIMSTMVSQTTSLTTVYSSVYSGADQRKHQSSATLAFVTGIHLWPVNSPHTGPVTWKMFPFDDVIMYIWNFKTIYYTNMSSHLPYMSLACWSDIYKTGMAWYASHICHSSGGPIIKKLFYFLFL